MCLIVSGRRKLPPRRGWARLAHQADEFLARNRAVFIAVVFADTRPNLRIEFLARNDVVDVAVEIQPEWTHLPSAQNAVRPVLELDGLKVAVMARVRAPKLPIKACVDLSG